MRWPQNARTLLAALAACGIAVPALAAQNGRKTGRPPVHEAAKPPRNGMPRLGPGPGWQPKPRAQMLERLEKMTPEQRERVLERLPPERRQRVEQQLEQYHNMTPEQRERLQQRYQWFSQLPPERQEAIRKGFQRFQKLPADRQGAVRQEVQQLSALPEAERQARMNSDEFRSRFDRREQQIIRDVTGAFPE